MAGSRIRNDRNVPAKQIPDIYGFALYGHVVNSENGVTLVSVEWSDKIGKSTVVIKKGTKTAKLEFNEAEMAPWDGGVCDADA